MFQFAKKSAELIRTTVEDIEEQIRKIKLTRVQIGEGKNIKCIYEFHLTMVDGKVKKLTPTIHKILAHGKDIIEYQSLPIGELSEEAQESLNKFYKKYRLQTRSKHQGCPLYWLHINKFLEDSIEQKVVVGATRGLVDLKNKQREKGKPREAKQRIIGSCFASRATVRKHPAPCYIAIRSENQLQDRVSAAGCNSKIFYNKKEVNLNAYNQQ
ncbi:hypothetical protein EVAR_69875_1 [Eumeta japonica]|uniref:Uncharacterized protein n=1 Tax=Eumeta variegata TaxID=151549 RepID=A0A4C2A8U1_EUMVA|nr:hypothetical protein EVAR_69875_1 [Eumeta japonica]